MIRYPRPLNIGDTIALTAPSSGVLRLNRLDEVIAHLRMQGYKVVEGKCLRGNRNGASAPAKERAAELMHFLSDDGVAAVFPPCGGDLAIETLPFLDFEKLSSIRPKWMLGYSDISTILLPLMLLSGWANAHGPVLMNFPPNQLDSFASYSVSVLAIQNETVISQSSSVQHLVPDYSTDPVSYSSGQTRWRALGDDPDREVHMRGRLIGGCLDTITRLVGTRYGDVPKFVAGNRNDGVILYLENGGLRVGEFARAIVSLKLNGWFDCLAGILIGRHGNPDGGSNEYLTFTDVLNTHLGELECPILIDADIGHTFPQLTLINGSLAEVEAVKGSARILQTLS